MPGTLNAGLGFGIQPMLPAPFSTQKVQVILLHEISTGTLRERPQRTVCLHLLRKGDVLVVCKPDRLARSLKDLIEIMQNLNRRSVGFRSLTDSIDATNSGSTPVFHIFGRLAEFEHSLIRERTITGLAAARAQGRKGGRKPALASADIRRAAAMLGDANITQAEIARHFGVSRVTLNAALSRAGWWNHTPRRRRAPSEINRGGTK